MKYGGYKFQTGEEQIIDVSPYWAAVLKHEDHLEQNSDRKYKRHSCQLELCEKPIHSDLMKFTDMNLKALLEDDELELLHLAMTSLSEIEKDAIESIFYKGMKGYEYASLRNFSPSKVSRIKRRAVKKLRSSIQEMMSE